MAYEEKDAGALKSIATRELTKSIQTLTGICTGIAADNHISDAEISFLSTWLTEYSQVAKTWPGSVIAERVRHILDDGVVTEEERADLLQTLKQVTGQDFVETGSTQPEVAGIPLDNIDIIFSNTVFCFTGRFMSGTRKYCEDMTKRLGCTPVKNISGNVNYLILGSFIEPSWVHESYGRKIEAAMQLRETEHTIAIVSEQKWIDATKELATK